MIIIRIREILREIENREKENYYPYLPGIKRKNLTYHQAKEVNMYTFFRKVNRAWLVMMLCTVFLATAHSAPSVAASPEQLIHSLQESIVHAAEKVSAAVVNIRTIRFTQDFFFNIVPQEGLGSGVIFDSAGYILTNEHVVSRAREIRVVLPDGREFEGKLIGSDARADLAVLKIEAEEIPVAILGDSGKLRAGEFCLAIGNPFGLQNTVTFGVVSATGRHIQATRERILEDLIQTDAPINPGNSGGPLINITGEVIGINTAIIPYAQGIGFAIPVNVAKDIIDELIEYGRVIRPWLGIYYLPVTAQVKERFSLTVDRGIYIAQVALQGPAEQAGIQEGDVIVRINDHDIGSAEDVRELMKKARIGQRANIVLMRHGEYEELTIELGEMPADR